MNKLTLAEHKVLRKGGTEIPFSSPLNNAKTGMFNCIGCDQELFSADVKYDSGSGWPSFTSAIKGAVKYNRDSTLGMERTEVVCSKCDGHLGHVFAGNGPTPNSDRYCINGVCLIHQPTEEESYEREPTGLEAWFLKMKDKF